MSHHRPARARRALTGTVLVGATLLAGCGGGDPASTGEAPPTTAVAGAGASTTAAAAAGTSATVHVADSKLGRILVDGQGRTLYGFTKDTAGTPTCTGGCLNAWPPVIIEDGKLPAGLDTSVFTLVASPEGQQLKAGDWPLYLYAADATAGDTKGQGSGGVWFVVDGQGELVRSAAGATTTTAAVTSPY
jgi:predicted lipoprotein with Yx(FWY)xxD motif